MVLIDLFRRTGKDNRIIFSSENLEYRWYLLFNENLRSLNIRSSSKQVNKSEKKILES